MCDQHNIIQIDESNWRIKDGAVHVFLFTGTKRALLIDTGFGPGDL